VGLRAGLDDVEKGKFLTLPELELGPLGHPARRQSLYRLCYPGPQAYEEWMYKSKFSLPRHYLEVSGQRHSPAALPPVPTG
jgi:hypothetical protein